jgi:hypothetical protein
MNRRGCDNFHTDAESGVEAAWRLSHTDCVENGLESLNSFSIGIEIANYGWLDVQGDGSYKRSDTPRFRCHVFAVPSMTAASAHWRMNQTTGNRL